MLNFASLVLGLIALLVAPAEGALFSLLAQKQQLKTHQRMASRSRMKKTDYGAIMTSYVEQMANDKTQSCGTGDTVEIEGVTQLDIPTGATEMEQVNRCGEYCSKMLESECGGFVFLYQAEGAEPASRCIFKKPFLAATCTDSTTRGSFRRMSTIVTTQ